MKDLISSIFNIFRYTGRILTLVRNTLFNILLLCFCLLLVVGLFSYPSFEIQPNTILRLQLVGDIVEEKQTISSISAFLEESLGINDPTRELLLQDVLDTIQVAANDDNITAMLLDLSDLGTVGLNQMQVIGQALEKFKSMNKPVIAAEDYYTQNQYYLASYADTLILNPMGGVDLHGFGVYRLYFQESLEKMRVNYHVFRVGTYKSAIEPITRNSMSDEARSQNSQWLHSLWNSYMADISSQRSLSPSAISDYINDLNINLSAAGGDTAQLALSTGLVDRLLTREEVRSFLRSLTGVPVHQQPEIISSLAYITELEPSYTYSRNVDNKIGIIVAEGNILGGQQPAGVIGGDTLSEMIRNARTDETVKAVVLRINSGGGSAFASEIIRQELLELKKAGKPLIVSMGTLAASGGYWISADADEIWAAPTSITGSIGIFGAIPTFEKTLQKAGIHSDGVGTTNLSAGLNLAQPLSPALKESIQLTVDNGYERFLSIVANGRQIERPQLENIAEGRVFSGTTAQEIGLVDKLGSLQQAIAAAAEKAGIQDYSAEYIGKATSLKEHLLQRLTSRIAAVISSNTPIVTALVRLYTTLQDGLGGIMLFDDPHGIYAHSMLQKPL